jgi:hypothetical protein
VSPIRPLRLRQEGKTGVDSGGRDPIARAETVDNARAIRLSAALSVIALAPKPSSLGFTNVRLDVSPLLHVLRTLSDGEVDGAGRIRVTR